MIEIWQECASFQTKSQRLAGQVRTIMKKGWFSNLEILKIHQKMNNEQDSNTVPDKSRINKQKWTTNFGKWKHHTTKQRTTKQPKINTITRTKGKSRKFKENYQQWKDYLTIIKKYRMENSWDRNKKKINQVLPYIPTELNAGAKVVCEEIRIPSKTTKKQSKPGWEIRLETQIKKIYENRPKW